MEKLSLRDIQKLRLFVKTFNDGHNYSLLFREKLKKLIQMQLSQKKELFSQFIAVFLKSKLILEHFQKKLTLIAYVFPKLRTRKTWLNKNLKSSVSEHLSTSNMIRGTKYCWILNHTTFIIFIDHFEGKAVGKSVS